MTSEHRNFAVKYRPQTFADLVGQDVVAETITNALKLGRVSHAYFFYGPRGCGKTTAARILAKSLNCTGHKKNAPAEVPCGKCPQCLEIADGNDIDVLEIDAASNTQVEKVREVIIDTVSLSAARDRYKIFILDEVHMLSAGSFNALLKTIEEPPSHIVFILATTEKHKVPQTILSRCQSFRFRPIAHDDMVKRIKYIADEEKMEISDKAVGLMADAAAGALRDALTLLDRAVSFCGGKITEEPVREMLGVLPEGLVGDCIHSLIAKDEELLHSVFENIRKEGYDIFGFLRQLNKTAGDFFYFKMNLGAKPFEGADKLCAGISAGDIALMFRRIAKVIDDVRFSDMPSVSAEIALYSVMRGVLNADSFIKRLEALERGGGVSQTPPAEGREISRPLDAPQISAPAPKPAAAECPRASVPSGNNADWEKLKTHVQKTRPLLGQMLAESAVNFNNGKMVLTVDDAFHFDSIQERMEDIKRAMQEVGIADMKFEVAVSENGGSILSNETDDAATEISADAPLVEASDGWRSMKEESLRVVRENLKKFEKHFPEGRLIK